MMTTQSAIKTWSALPVIESEQVNRIIDACFEKMLDDYRVNRFFNSNPANQQTQPLKKLVNSLLNGAKLSEQLDALNEFFTAAFARNNAKPSLVTGNDFAFLLDVIGGQDIQTITPLCECHSFLLKLLPDDSHYDVLMEHLKSTLKGLNVSQELSEQLLAFAENGREGCLGRLENLT